MPLLHHSTKGDTLVCAVKTLACLRIDQLRIRGKECSTS